MADKFYSERNLKFLLYEVFDVERLAKIPYFQDHGRESFDMALETAAKIGRDLLFPYFVEMDKEPPRLENGEVKVHPMIKDFLKECGEGGWLSSIFPYDIGGQQLPMTLAFATNFIFSSANFSAAVYAGLVTGSAHLIISFGTDEQKEKYLPRMLEGKWGGTMALTEPQAGSSLGDITCTAYPTEEGYYKMRGQKIFISGSDYDCVDNVVNMVLARAEGAPPGLKGISLFLVPKMRIEDDGSLVRNDINVAGIYHKMGYKGCPILQLSLGDEDDCRGHLVGELNRGLFHMFQMMNEARLMVGVQAVSIASAAYYAALEYANERPQGRNIMEKDPLKPQIPIVEHADVKRMLLFQRAVIDGSLSLLFECTMCEDLMRNGDDENIKEDVERYKFLLDILTPVAKTYPSEMGIHSVSQGLQCLGGYGYCDEFRLEQHYRDARIHPIHEGTTGIQGMDLLGRKVVMKDGKAFNYYLEELEKTMVEANKAADLEPYAERLDGAIAKLKEVTANLVGFAMKGQIERYLSDAVLYLEMFGIITIAWQWLKQGITAEKALKSDPAQTDVKFYEGKLITMKYFFHYELPKTEGLAVRLMEEEGITTEMEVDHFTD